MILKCDSCNHYFDSINFRDYCNECYEYIYINKDKTDFYNNDKSGCGSNCKPVINNKDDKINHPYHYKQHPSGVEVIEITRHMNFNKGNIIKYILRSSFKGKEIEDLKKAEFYIKNEIKRLEGK